MAASQLKSRRLLGGYRRIASYAVAQWRTLTVVLILTVATSGLAVIQPWPLKILVDYVLAGGADTSAVAETYVATLSRQFSPHAMIGVVALASLVIAALGICVEAVLTWAWAAAGQRMIYALAADMFARLQRLSLLFHARRNVGDSLNRLTEDTWCVDSVTRGVLVGPTQSLLTLCTVSVVAFNLDADVAALSLVVAPALALGAFVFGRRLKRVTRRQREARSDVISFVQQTLGAIPLVQLFTSEPRNRERYNRLSEIAVETTKRARLMDSGYALFHGATTTGGVAIIIFACGQKVLAGAMTVGTMLVFIAYIRSMQGAARGLLTAYAQLKSAEASVDRVLEVLDSTEDVRELPNAVPFHKGVRPPHICFERVTFGYEPSRPILREVSIEILPGESVGLVGATGAGKSTLAALIPRFFDPLSGRITIDGVDLRDIQKRSLRAQVALVLQDPFLLPLTVADNIAYGRPDTTIEKIRKAAVSAHADAFIRELPSGYGTRLVERGANLSGGEKQRIAIARALVKDAPIVILDEPTSALDTGSEGLILDALKHLMSGRTVVMIAHRLSTIRQMNRIVVLDHGRVIETGTHDELLAAGGAYSRLYRLQVGGAHFEAAQ